MTDHTRQFRKFIAVLRQQPETKAMLSHVGVVFDKIGTFARPVRNEADKAQEQLAMSEGCQTLIQILKSQMPEGQFKFVPSALRVLSRPSDLSQHHKLAREVQPVIRRLALS